MWYKNSLPFCYLLLLTVEQNQHQGVTSTLWEPGVKENGGVKLDTPNQADAYRQPSLCHQPLQLFIVGRACESPMRTGFEATRVARTRSNQFSRCGPDPCHGLPRGHGLTGSETHAHGAPRYAAIGRPPPDRAWMLMRIHCDDRTHRERRSM